MSPVYSVTYLPGSYPAETHQEQWDGKDDSGNRVSSGVYVYRMKAGDYVQSRKMVLLK